MSLLSCKVNVSLVLRAAVLQVSQDLLLVVPLDYGILSPKVGRVIGKVCSLLKIIRLKLGSDGSLFDLSHIFMIFGRCFHLWLHDELLGLLVSAGLLLDGSWLAHHGLLDAS